MKAAASLTGSLLARKGAAYPASYSAPSSHVAGPGAVPTGSRAYNDPRVIASAPPTPHPASAPQAADAHYVQEFRPATPPVPTGMPNGSVDDAGTHAAELPHAMDKMGRVRLSVRLDPDRYLRVKMASARTRWSAQDIVIAALDRYLSGSAARPDADDHGDDREDGELN